MRSLKRIEGSTSDFDDPRGPIFSVCNFGSEPNNTVCAFSSFQRTFSRIASTNLSPSFLFQVSIQSSCGLVGYGTSRWLR